MQSYELWATSRRIEHFTTPVHYHRLLPLPLPLPPPLPRPLPLPRPWNPDLSGFSPSDWIPLFFWRGISSSSTYLALLLVMKEISRDPPGPNFTSFWNRELWFPSWRAATRSPKGRASSFASDTRFQNASACRSSFTSNNLQVVILKEKLVW